VILLRTSQTKVIGEVPNFMTSIPISIISPFLHELTKSISDINLVTLLDISN